VDLESWVTTFLSYAIPLYLLAFAIYVARMFREPRRVPDLVLVVDALSYDLAAFLVILSILLRTPITIPCAIALVLWIYALDIYVAKYLESKELG